MVKPIFPPKEYGVSPTPFSSSGEYKTQEYETQLDTLQASKGPSMNDVRTVKREGGKRIGPGLHLNNHPRLYDIG